MIRKLLVIFILSVAGMALHSCMPTDCGDSILLSSRRTTTDDASRQQKQFVLSLPLGDMLHPGTDNHTRLSNLHQRTLRQLFLQWNKMVMKDHSRHAQRAQAITISSNDTAHYIGCGDDAALYIYRIRHIVI